MGRSRRLEQSVGPWPRARARALDGSLQAALARLAPAPVPGSGLAGNPLAAGLSRPGRPAGSRRRRPLPLRDHAPDHRPRRPPTGGAGGREPAHPLRGGTPERAADPRRKPPAVASGPAGRQHPARGGGPLRSAPHRHDRGSRSLAPEADPPRAGPLPAAAAAGRRCHRLRRGAPDRLPRQAARPGRRPAGQPRPRSVPLAPGGGGGDGAR